jgi:acetolactate synthase-1/2/3 large subunit
MVAFDECSGIGDCCSFTVTNNSHIWCDSDFGMISLKQIHEFGKSAFTRFTNPNFVTLAQSFGAIGYYVKTTEEFPKILKKAKESTSVPVIIAIDVDYSKNQILLNDDFND